MFRTLGKYSKIEQRYRPVLQVKYEGQLTKGKIIQDCGKVLKKAEYAFNIIRLPLYDKEDETDIGLDNDTHHKYCLLFKHPERGFKIRYKVKRDQYMDAVIGAEYLVVITPTYKIAAVYQATNLAHILLQHSRKHTMSLLRQRTLLIFHSLIRLINRVLCKSIANRKRLRYFCQYYP